MFDIACHANDPHPYCCSFFGDAFTDGILTRPKVFGKGLVHNHGRFTVRMIVLFVEETPCTQWNVHGCKIIRQYRTCEYGDVLLGRILRAVFDCKGFSLIRYQGGVADE